VVILKAPETASASFLLRNIASIIMIWIIDKPSTGIAKKIMGTPADATLGIHKNKHNANSDFPFNI